MKHVPSEKLMGRVENQTAVLLNTESRFPGWFVTRSVDIARVIYSHVVKGHHDLDQMTARITHAMLVIG
jgi:hypothetical protein